jgi:hypothetical protein
VGFEPTNYGFAIRSLSPLGHPAGNFASYLRSPFHSSRTLPHRAKWRHLRHLQTQRRDYPAGRTESQPCRCVSEDAAEWSRRGLPVGLRLKGSGGRRLCRSSTSTSAVWASPNSTARPAWTRLRSFPTAQRARSRQLHPVPHQPLPRCPDTPARSSIVWKMCRSPWKSIRRPSASLNSTLIFAKSFFNVFTSGL